MHSRGFAKCIFKSGTKDICGQQAKVKKSAKDFYRFSQEKFYTLDLFG